MNVIHEVAMLAAVASPMIVIAAINVSLYLAGERGTLLLPDRAAYPTVALDSLAVVQGYLAPMPEPEFVEEMRLAA
jgi:hypothetical protein